MSAAYSLDGRSVPREHFYAVACDPRRSVVVEACAGAGKTWMLVSRILRALLDGAKPQEIVAITFTRKAAGEMRERLGDWLREFAAASHEGRVKELLARGMSVAEAETAAPQLKALQQTLLAGGRMVEIRTFHAWFAQLLRVAPMELLQAEGISPELKLLEDEADLLPELWQRFHSAVLVDDALLADYRALITERGRNTVQKWLTAALSRRFELRLAGAELIDGVPEASSVMPECAGLERPLDAFLSWHKRLAALAPVLGAAKGAKAREAATGIEQALLLSDVTLRFEGLRNALLTKEGMPRKQLGSEPELLACQDAVMQMAAALEQHQAWLAHRRMSALALVLIEAFEKLKRQRGLVDMNDLERGALALLTRPELSAWVQQRLDAQIRHLLIDEFQDTSPLQWHALRGWLEAYAGAGGVAPSVFIVGDPKQSIYRFRRAEPRVFLAARDFVRQALQGAVLECDHTRRNSPAVLAAVNEVFESARAAQLYEGFREHTTESTLAPQDGVLCIEPDEGADEEEGDVDEGEWRPSLSAPRHEPELKRRAAEAALLTRAIGELLQQGLRPGQIFVLARKREPLRVLAQALKAAGIAHAAPEDQDLLGAPDVRDLLALFDVLASSGHDLSLAHALRSPLFGASEADLLCIAAQAVGQGWWLALQQASELSEALLRARSLLARWAAEAQRRSPHDLLDLIVHEGDLLARVAAAAPASERSARLHAVDELLAQALNLDGGRYASLYGFVRALKSRALKLSAPAEVDAVQLLTVHGAKGLEAEAVFLIDTDAGAARADSATLLVDWPVEASRPRRAAFIASEAKPPPALQALMDEEREQRQREELNGLYVAMTRARSRLIISRTRYARKGKEASWWDRLQALATPWQPTAQTQNIEVSAFASLLELPPAPPVPPREPKPNDAAEDPDSAALGDAMHRVLEWASGPAPMALPRLLASAAQMYGLDARRTQQLERSVAAILGGAECAPFFDLAVLQWAGNEVAVQREGQDLRIDRLVCRVENGEPVWWVLDYKLNPHPERNSAYLEQLRGYREALENMQPGERIRTAFITAQGHLVECS